jgi:hypothetical protein
VFCDPALRDLLGIAPSLSAEQADAWLAELSVEQRGRLALTDWSAVDLASDDGANERNASAYFAPLTAEWVEAPLLEAGARRLLRRFARRLPGFAASGPAFLRTNFLSGRATLERGMHGWIARLGPTPLDLILRMSGLKRAAFELRPGSVRVGLESEG